MIDIKKESACCGCQAGKMRICILTQPLRANYGGILQAYALQKALRDMGHDVTTLLFHPPLSWVPSGIKKHLLTARRFFAKYLKGNKGIIYCNPDKQTRFAYREMDRFISEHINCLEATTPLSASKLPAFDAFVVGSDQVWRPAYSPYLPNFYLDFLKDEPVKRMAYAASFGVDTWEADEDMTKRIRPLAQMFDVISVREKTGVDLCAKYLGVKAEVMPDPTLLLTADDYLALCDKEADHTEPYIAAYILDESEEVEQFLNRASKQLRLPVRHIGRIDWSICADSPQKWLSCIAGASFVITDSFHGTVFSLLFNREFLSVINRERGASRFASLLEAMGMPDRMIAKDDLARDLPSARTINPKQVKTVIDGFRSTGQAFLRTNL